MDYVLTIALVGVKPEVMRQVRVPGDATLGILHDVIQLAMGWHNDHLHAFRIGEHSYGNDPGGFDDMKDEDRFSLSAVLRKGDAFQYEYDFGDGWKHDIGVDDVLPAAPAPAFACLAGQRACPPEDYGGARAYSALLKILADPAHPERAERLERVGEGFDPAAFNLEEARRQLEFYGEALRDHFRLRRLKEAARAISGPKRGARKTKRRR